MERIKPITIFEREAAQRLPGFLYSFNIADLKRRNSHLGHQVGTADIREFDALVKAMATSDTAVERVSGERWYLMTQHNATDRVQAMLDHYRRTEPFRAGWRVWACRNGIETTTHRAVTTRMMRAVRCLYTKVATPDDLTKAIDELADNDWNLPVNRPLLLAAVVALPRERWHCVADYPDELPCCAFCGGREFDWEDGDAAVYSGYGRCENCGADIAIEDIAKVDRMRPVAVELDLRRA